MTENKTDEALRQITSQIEALNLDPKAKKAFVRQIVEQNWPELPTFSTMKQPKVQEVETATVGTGVVPIFKDHGIYKAIVVKVGTHYESPRYAADPAVPTYMIAGGFINLTQTPGATHVPPNDKKAEDPRMGAIRELEEEIIDADGNPVLKVAPSRLKPMDEKTLTFPWGERRVVIGYMVPLEPAEVAAMKHHIEKLETDTGYRHAVRAHTVNAETGKPEICTVCALPVSELAEGKHTLLHPDQRSLFQNINAELSRSLSKAG